MYKTILFSDTHLKNNESIGRIDNNGNSLMTMKKLSHIATVIDYAIASNADSIIIAGDLFDTPNPSNKIKSMLSKIFSKAIKNKINIYIIGGNHETTDNKYYNLMSESSYSNFLHFVKNQSITTEDGIYIKLISSGQEHTIEKIQVLTPTILIGHFQIEGAKYDNERLCTDFIPQSLLHKFKKVYCGHFHKRQIKNNWMYIGALCRNNFGEADNVSGFMELIIKNGEINEKFVPVDDIKFKVISLEDEIESEDDILNAISNSIKGNNAYKFIFKIPEGMKVHRRRIRDYAYSLNPFHVSIEYEYIKDKSIYSISKEFNYMEAILEYSKYKKMTKKLTKIGINIAKEIF